MMDLQGGASISKERLQDQMAQVLNGREGSGVKRKVTDNKGENFVICYQNKEEKLWQTKNSGW